MEVCRKYIPQLKTELSKYNPIIEIIGISLNPNDECELEVVFPNDSTYVQYIKEKIDNSLIYRKVAYHGINFFIKLRIFSGNSQSTCGTAENLSGNDYEVFWWPHNHLEWTYFNIFGSRDNVRGELLDEIGLTGFSPKVFYRNPDVSPLISASQGLFFENQELFYSKFILGRVKRGKSPSFFW